MPDVKKGPRLPIERFAALVEDDTALPTFDPGEPDKNSLTIANYIIELLSSGDTLQFGLGKIPAAVLEGLAPRGLSGLGFHAGMISPEMLPAIDANVFTKGVMTGVALGNQKFYQEVSKRPGIRFSPVGMTHSISILYQIPRLVSVNSVIKVDLTGQANCEYLTGMQISGQGG